MAGLGKNWDRTVKVLSEISRVYRKFNRAISLGRDIEIRREAVKMSAKDPRVVIDLGSGDGTFTEIAVSAFPTLEMVVMLDVLPEMLKNSVKGDKTERVQGVFECLPFRDEVFDHALAAFSLRDAKDLERALEEVRRVLRADGKLILVDLGKPDSFPVRWAVYAYWAAIAPLLATLRVGLKGTASLEILRTLMAHPPNSELFEIYKRYFSSVSLRKGLMGGLIMLEASRKARMRAS